MSKSKREIKLNRLNLKLSKAEQDSVKYSAEYEGFALLKETLAGKISHISKLEAGVTSQHSERDKKIDYQRRNGSLTGKVSPGTIDQIAQLTMVNREQEYVLRTLRRRNRKNRYIYERNGRLLSRLAKQKDIAEKRILGFRAKIKTIEAVIKKAAEKAAKAVTEIKEEGT